MYGIKKRDYIKLLGGAMKFLYSFLLCVAIPIYSQTPRDLLFHRVDSLFTQAKLVHADFFSPTHFETAQKAYQKAEEDFKAGKNLEDIKTKLKVADAYFQKAIHTTSELQATFKDCIKARNDALLVDAPSLRKTLWQEAESIMEQASRLFEQNDLAGAKGKVRKAERMYRQAELEAIKANYLDGTRQLLKQAEIREVKKRAPETLLRSIELADRAESLLTEDRYDTDEPRQLAQEAQYEARHALYLNDTIAFLQQSKISLERILLNAEMPVRRIADALNLNVEFDKGTEGPVQAILGEIRKLYQEIEMQQNSLREKEEQIATLNQQLAKMESQLGELKVKEADLTQAMDRLLEQQRLAREKYERVEKMFSPEEAQILRSGDKVILRLYRITFPTGKSTIESKYFGLLAKVCEALKEYPDSHVTVEGHTDSRGSEETNQKLSTERAEAVREYLLATGGIDGARITAVGYGETKPIASNDTEEGRRKNRRIDVVISP